MARGNQRWARASTCEQRATCILEAGASSNAVRAGAITLGSTVGIGSGTARRRRSSILRSPTGRPFGRDGQIYRRAYDSPCSFTSRRRGVERKGDGARRMVGGDEGAVLGDVEGVQREVIGIRSRTDWAQTEEEDEQWDPRTSRLYIHGSPMCGGRGLQRSTQAHGLMPSLIA